ncbi:DUF3667 domain-containing protein [Maribacter halichondriae]|uniref:DUF3667 domain-containing protein n=1 Tax=Maribacter halichondriae TaxID=2980554 RepID=UPI00235A0C93|nr:DUF3667 domain-containing protein [Maribacter sp. Hal144]
MTNKPTIPSAGRYKLQYRGTECTNCGHPLDMSDKFCPNCSQANSTKKLSLKDFFDEFFSSIISYDSKLFNTLSVMLWRPGKITRDYINGKRVSYTNPFRFLLSLTIIYFLMMTVGGDFSGLDRINLDGNELNDIKVKEGILDITVKDEDADVQAILDSVPDLGFIANAIARKDSIMLADPNAHYDSIAQEGFLTRFFEKRELFGLLLDKEKIVGYTDLKPKYKIPDSRENQASFNVARSFSRVKKEPSAFITSSISRLPFAIFFFLPLFALFIWLAYIRKKYNYTDHLVFSFHNTSLLFILLIISYLIDSIFDIDSSWFFLLVFLIYLFIGMKRFYGQGIFKTSIKYVFLNMIFFILAMFSMLIFFAGNIFTF